MGRMEVTKEFADMFRYRTPSLRNIELTAPYMHNGSIETLGRPGRLLRNRRLSPLRHRPAGS